jgi:hypothetical protein
MEDSEAAGYREDRRNPPVTHSQGRWKGYKEEKEAEAEPEKIQQGQANCQGDEDREDPLSPFAVREKGIIAVRGAFGKGNLAEKGQGQNPGDETHPEREEPWAGAQLIMVGVFQGQDQSR